MIDRFDPEKYSTQDNQISTEKLFDDDEPISLDTREKKYIERIKK